MGFIESINSGFARYVDFSARSSRSEYWFWTLFVILGEIVLSILAGILGTLVSILLFVFVIGVFIPSLAVSIRRLHDVGKSGWWIFIALIPIIGTIILLVWFVSAGEEDDNAWGANPLSKASDLSQGATVM